MKRAQNQPISTEIRLTDDLFVKTAVVADEGTIIPTHSHSWDHITLLAYGSMRVVADGKVLGDFTGPTGILIKNGMKHTFITTSPGVVFCCIHAVHGADDIGIEELHELEMED